MKHFAKRGGSERAENLGGGGLWNDNIGVNAELDESSNKLNLVYKEAGKLFGESLEIKCRAGSPKSIKFEQQATD